MGGARHPPGARGCGGRAAWVRRVLAGCSPNWLRAVRCSPPVGVAQVADLLIDLSSAHPMHGGGHTHWGMHHAALWLVNREGRRVRGEPGSHGHLAAPRRAAPPAGPKAFVVCAGTVSARRAAVRAPGLQAAPDWALDGRRRGGAHGAYGARRPRRAQARLAGARANDGRGRAKGEALAGWVAGRSVFVLETSHSNAVTAACAASAPGVCHVLCHAVHHDARDGRQLQVRVRVLGGKRGTTCGPVRRRSRTILRAATQAVCKERHRGR